MKELSLVKVYVLLGQSDIPGSATELEKLRTRINELVRLNGEDWVRDNRQKLLSEWEYIVQAGIIGR
jgi:hypothetical protein